MNSESVSVVIPAYNSAKTLERAVNSVLTQTLLPNEIIIVDDCSTDFTEDVVKSIISPNIEIIFIKNEKNMGPSHSRNRGIAKAKSKWIAFLDADDFWHPSKIQFQMSLANELQLSFVGACFKISDGNDLEPFVVDLNHKILTIRDFYFANPFSTPSVLVKKSADLYFDENMKFSEDYDLWLKLMKKYEQAGLIKLPLVILGKPAYGSSGLSGQLWNMEKGELRVLSKIDNYIIRMFSISFSLIKYFRRIAKLKMRS